MISAAEVSAAMGMTMQVTASEPSRCVYTGANLVNINIRIEPGDLASARTQLSEPEDIAIGPYPAVIGGFVGTVLYIQGDGQLLVVQAVLVTDDATSQAQVVQIGTTAASRWLAPVRADRTRPGLPS